MRNLKKILALVLALVMTMSVMATAAFTDAATIDTSYDEAAEVLAGLKVFVGRTDGSFDPKANITRAEVAAIIYRIVTGDVKNESINLYTEGADFTDTKGHWAEGYIGYCNNAGFIAGYGNGKFGPNDNVTGMQAAAMVLRAVGYDAQDEFTGANWDKYVAKYAQELGLFKNLKADVNLNKAVSREVVAEILFQAIQADMVEWTPAFDYQPVTFLGAGTQSLGEKTFNLKKGARTTVDNWGRPGHIWTAYTTNTKIATIVEDYKYATNVAVSECDIAHAVGQKADQAYLVFDNAAVANAAKTTVRVLATTAKLGAQGQILEVYTDRIVLIDTLLAKVVAVADATYDANGHLKTASKITLDVYQANGDTAARFYQTNGKTNYTVAAGDYILINAHLKADGTVKADWQNYFEYMDIVAKATSIEGAQTVIWYLAGQHTVNGTTYDDADRFHLNVATTATANRTWFFDQFGNLIGNVAIATQYNYAAVKNMWWAGDAATGLGVAKATLVYMDGTENVVTVSGIKLDGSAAANKYAVPAYAPAQNGYDMAYTAGNTTTAGVLYVASYAPTNAGAANNTTYGVITTASVAGHLFRVETKADGTVLLDEVTAETTTNIRNKFAVVGTALVNSNTQFLMYNTATKTFNAFVDFNNMPSILNTTAVVDYVNGTDGYAKYVYIYGKPDSTVTYNFVMPLSVNHSAELKDGDINYYVVTVVNVDGTQTTLKVKTTDKAAVLDVLTNTSNLNKLYYVTFEGDYAKSLTLISTTELAGKTDLPALADTLRICMYQDLLTDAAKITRTGNDLAVVKGGATLHFNVTEATQIVGELPEGRQSAKNVYVLSNAANNVAVKVWVVANSATVAPATTPSLTAATVATPSLTLGVAMPTTGTITSLKEQTNTELVGLRPAIVDATTVSLTWYKLNTTTGTYELYTGVAVAGTYICTATMTTTATNDAGAPFSVSGTATVTVTGANATAPLTFNP